LHKTDIYNVKNYMKNILQKEK